MEKFQNSTWFKLWKLPRDEPNWISLFCSNLKPNHDVDTTHRHNFFFNLIILVFFISIKNSILGFNKKIGLAHNLIGKYYKTPNFQIKKTQSGLYWETIKKNFKSLTATATNSDSVSRPEVQTPSRTPPLHPEET